MVWANEHGPTKAENVLERLKTHKSLGPNSITFITLMDSYARSGYAESCLRILSMIEKAFIEGNSAAKPTR